MNLSNFTQGRDNNFNLIRIIAAFSVLVTHSFILVSGSPEAEPLRESIGLSMGNMAVDIFFITSGFLVTASLLYRQSVIEFVWARALRIYPALLVLLLLTIFGLGIYFTSLPLQSYLTNFKTYYYFLRCASLFFGVAMTLPGVFEGNPYPLKVNASLWTLQYEVVMYALLVIFWVIAGMTSRRKTTIFKAALVSLAAVSGAWVLFSYFFYPLHYQGPKLLFMFFTGAAFYVLKDHIKISHPLFWVLAIALLSSAFINKHAFYTLYVLTSAYILFYIAYIPSGFIRKYNQLGDYSYGIYIYAMPVQQSVAALVPHVSVFSMIVISTIVTFAFAILSWHLLEKRALGLKGMTVNHTRKILSYRLSSRTDPLAVKNEG